MMKYLVLTAVLVLSVGTGVTEAAPVTMPSGAVVDAFSGYGFATYGAQWHQVGSSANSDMRIWIDFGQPVWIDKVLQQNIIVATKTAFKVYNVYVAADETGMDPTDWSEYDTYVAALVGPISNAADEWRGTSEFWRIRKRYLAIEITQTYNGAVVPGQWGSFGDWDEANLDSRTMSGGVVLDPFEVHNLLDYSSGTGPWFDVQKELASAEVRMRLDMGEPSPVIQVGVSNIYVDTYQAVRIFEVYCASDENDPGFDPTDWNEYDTLAATLPLDAQGYKADKFRLTPVFDVGEKRYLAIRVTSNYRGAAWMTNASYSKANFSDWAVVLAPSAGTVVVVR